MKHEKAPKYVVALLNNHKPIAIIELAPDNADTRRVDIVIPENQDLEEVVAVLHSSLQAAQYLNWKRDGVLPTPPDFDVKQEGEGPEIEDFPF